jgi:hypothetical protein
MKIRNGFVSNSSSSSFCIYGFENDSVFGRMDLEEIFKFFNPSIVSKDAVYEKRDGAYVHPEWLRDTEGDMEKIKNALILKEYDGRDAIDLIFYLANSDIETFGDYYCYTYYGKSLTSIKDNETGLEFKQNVEKEAQRIFNKEDIKFGIIEESWYDG